MFYICFWNTKILLLSLNHMKIGKKKQFDSNFGHKSVSMICGEKKRYYKQEKLLKIF